MNKEIYEALLKFVCKSFFVEEDEFEHDESLIDQGIIDSFGLVEIAAFMEKTFSIKIGEEEMIRDNFGSLHKMVNYIERKQAGEL